MLSEQSLTDTDQKKATEKPNQDGQHNIIRKKNKQKCKCTVNWCFPKLLSLHCVCVLYLVGIRMSEHHVVLPWAVGGSVFVHSGGGRRFVQQATLCT